MSIGAYSIVIVDEAGVPLSDPIERLANTSHPDLGHKVWIEGVAYEVVDVHHEEDPDSRASIPYSTARVCVRRLPGPVTPPGRRDEPEKPQATNPPAKILALPVTY